MALNFNQLTGVLGFGLGLVGNQIQTQSILAGARADAAIATRNTALVQANLDLQLDSLARQIRRTAATQRSQAAGSGFSVSSKSYLSVMSSTMSDFENQIVDLKNAAQNQINQIHYENELNQRAARQRAKASRIGGLLSTVQKLPGLISLFGD